MQIKARIQGDRIVVQLTFKNETNETLYLMNWLFDYFGMLGIPEMDASHSAKTARPTRELAYACVGPRNELVFLNGFGPSAPSGLISATAPRWPYGSRLPPGETYTGTVWQKLPICEWYANKAPRSSPTQLVRTREIRYRLEALRESACREPAKEHVNFPGAYSVRGRTSDFFEAIDHLDEPLELLKRTDKFSRFG
jgi:hypothetical protein